MSTAKNKLDTGLIRELAAILREADLGELEVEHEGLRVRVSKPLAPAVVHAAAAPAPAAAAPAALPAPATAAAASAAWPICCANSMCALRSWDRRKTEASGFH